MKKLFGKWPKLLNGQDDNYIMPDFRAILPLIRSISRKLENRTGVNGRPRGIR